MIEYLDDISAVPIGINKEDLSVFLFNMKKEFISVVTSQNIENTTQFVFSLIKEIAQKLLYMNIGFFDAEELIQENRDNIKSEYTNFVDNIKSNEKDSYLGVIIGIDKFFSLVERDETSFSEEMTELASMGNCNFILVDNATKIKNHAFDLWYQEHVHDNTGIWVGNGVNDQYTVNISGINRNLMNNCGNGYGFAINNGEPTMIKLVGASTEEED